MFFESSPELELSVAFQPDPKWTVLVHLLLANEILLGSKTRSSATSFELALEMLSMISTWMLLSNIGGNLGWVTYWESDILSSIYINNYRHRLRDLRKVLEK
jgi:hypothetical protein